MQQGEREGLGEARKGPALYMILVILLAAIVAATALAYLVVSPFFHQHAR